MNGTKLENVLVSQSKIKFPEASILENIKEEPLLRKCSIKRCEEMIPEDYQYKRCDACRIKKNASTAKFRELHREKYNEYGRKHALKHYYKVLEQTKLKKEEEDKKE